MPGKLGESVADAALAARLLDLIGASWKSQAIFAAAELRIADLLANGSQSLNVLAQATGCHAQSLHRLLRALASLGICMEEAEGSFVLTELGSLLRADVHPSVRSWAIWWGSYQWPVGGGLLNSVRTGASARKLATGRTGYAHIESDPQAALLFNQSMAELTRLTAGAIMRVYDFSGAQRLVDVGGGHGELLTQILLAFPAMQGVLFDLPHAVEGARERAAMTGIAPRCEIVAGSFFDFVPGGADVYLLKTVLHNWDDDQGAVILGNCRRAMQKDAKLILIERIMPEQITETVEAQAVARSDLNMLVSLGGRERTAKAFSTLLAASGFKLTRVIRSDSYLSVIEGIPD